MAYSDITERLRAASGHLKYGQTISMPEFSYYESMSAVELMDPKLDSGLALMSLPLISDLIDNGSLPKPENLTDAQVLGILDQQVKNFGLWIEGQSLIHTLYSCIYIHTPDLIENNVVIKSCLQACVYIAENIHKLIHQTTCLREDDYAYSAIRFSSLECDDHELETNLLNAEKHTQNESILGSLRFFRALFYMVNNLIKPRGAGFSAAESRIPFIIKQLETIKEREITVFSEFFNDKYCLTKIPYFPANKVYKVENYTYQMAIARIEKFIESMSALVTLTPFSDADSVISYLCSLPSYDNLSRIL